VTKPQTKDILGKVKELISNIEIFEIEAIKTKIKTWITEQNIGFGVVMMPLRVALVGDLKGVDVFEMIFMIGEKETMKRIERLLKVL